VEQLLITGGSGLIGSTLIAQLKKEYRITVLTRDISRCRLIIGNNINCITSLEQADDIGTYWGVINLAGEPIVNKRWSSQQKK